MSIFQGLTLRSEEAIVITRWGGIEAAWAGELSDEARRGLFKRFNLWLDKRNIKPGKDWDEQVVEAIRSCGSLVFVMIQDRCWRHIFDVNKNLHK